MLREGLLVFYCAAVGFVAAGVAASFYKMVTLEPAKFGLLGQGWLALVATFVFVGVSGPAIVMDTVIRNRVADRSGATGKILMGVLIAGMWSICSGILVLDLALAVKASLA